MRTLKLPFVETKNVEMFVIKTKTPLCVSKSSTGGNKFPSANTFLEILEGGSKTGRRSGWDGRGILFLGIDFFLTTGGSIIYKTKQYKIK